MGSFSVIIAVLMTVVGLAKADPQCPVPDPITHVVMLPNPADCGTYYMCSNGQAIPMKCPLGLHFNEELSVCDYPDHANCEIHCLPLGTNVNGVWTPASCGTDLADVGDQCKLQCDPDYQLKGSVSVSCTEDGWQSSNGAQIPSCVPLECIGEIIDDDLNKTLSKNASLLFVLDESGSVTEPNFLKTKDFVKDIVAKYTLSSNRSAGVITFSSNSVVAIHLTENSTTSFMNKVDAIQYRDGGTDILNALQAAILEINNFKVHPLTLVFIITDGQSSTDGNPAADILKAQNHPIFAIGISPFNDLVHLESLSSAGDNGIKHFFHTRDYDVLVSIGQYINPPAGSNSTNPGGSQCKKYP